MEILFHFVIWIVNRLPRRVALRLADVLGSLLYFNTRFTRFKGALEANIRTAFPDRFSDREVQEIARTHARDMVRTLVEVARMRELPALLERGIVQVEGLNFLKDAVKSGRGAVLLSAHMGNWEILMAVLPLMGFDVTAVVARQPHPLVNEWLVRERSRFGTRLIYYDEVKSDRIGELLASGGLLILLADQHNYGGKPRNIVPFFGIPVSVPAGPIAYSTRFQVPLIPVLALREPGDRHRITLWEPLRLVDTGGAEDFLINCRRMMELFESWITKHPHQWMWSNQRWSWLKEFGDPYQKEWTKE